MTTRELPLVMSNLHGILHYPEGKNNKTQAKSGYGLFDLNNENTYLE